MHQKVRLAILECDTPLPNTKERYAGYGGVFKSLLSAGAKAEGLNLDDVLDVTMHQIEDDPECYPELGEIDAVLLTGSSMWLSVIVGVMVG